MIILIELFFVIAFLLPKLFKITPYVVTSGSMEPLYPVGSLIYVKKIEPDKIKENDAITFYMENTNIVATHQVYEIDEKEDIFRTQGINNKDENGNIIKDPKPVSFSALIGKPILCVKYLGYINRVVTTPPGIYIIISFTILIVLISNIIEKE